MYDKATYTFENGEKITDFEQLKYALLPNIETREEIVAWNSSFNLTARTILYGESGGLGSYETYFHGGSNDNFDGGHPSASKEVNQAFKDVFMLQYPKNLIYYMVHSHPKLDYDLKPSPEDKNSLGDIHLKNVGNLNFKFGILLRDHEVLIYFDNYKIQMPEEVFINYERRK